MNAAAPLEFAVASGPYSLQAEALRRELSGRGGQRVASGQYLQLAWTLTGQARPYDIDGAKFKAIEPAAGSSGAWELFYRHDRLAVRGAAPSPARARVHTLGVNWYADAGRAAVAERLGRAQRRHRQRRR